MLRIALMPKYLNAWTRLLRRAPVLAQVFSLRKSKIITSVSTKNSHQSVNMAVTFQVYLAKPLWRISSSWAQLARPCRQSLLCFASHHLLRHLENSGYLGSDQDGQQCQWFWKVKINLSQYNSAWLLVDTVYSAVPTTTGQDKCERCTCGGLKASKQFRYSLCHEQKFRYDQWS